MHIRVCDGDRTTLMEIPDYRVQVSSALLGELKSIRGISLAS